MFGLKEIGQAAHENAASKGWWDTTEIEAGSGVHAPISIPEKLALIHSEVSEALEDYRDGKALNGTGWEFTRKSGTPCERWVEITEHALVPWITYYVGREQIQRQLQMPADFALARSGGYDAKPVGFPTELADILIRTLDLAAALNIDIDQAVYLKMKYNETRPHRHGGKLA